MTKKDYLIPMEVDEISIKAFNIAKSDIKFEKICNKWKRVIMIPATKGQYDAYMQPIWAEEKRMQRQHRCILTMPDGSTRRCDGNCELCKARSYERKDKGKFEPTGEDFFYGHSMSCFIA